MKGNLICSAGTREELQSMINKYFYSTNWIITDSMEIFNTAKQKTLDGYTVKRIKGRWRFELSA